jgi:CheY-like chemotaxis protein
MSAPANPAVPGPARRVLSLGHNSALLRARNAVIETAGYQVVTTKESSLMVQLAQEQHFDAVVLCNSIPLLLRKNAARELKTLRPKTPLIVICTASEQSELQNLCDALVLAEDGISQPLLEAISKLADGPET